MPQKIYVHINGEQFGPFTELELQEHVQNGRILLSDDARAEHSSGWGTVGRFLQMFDVAPPGAGDEVINLGGTQVTLEEMSSRAETADPEVQFNLGMLYFDGQEIALDYRQATRWFRRAAERGHAAAQVFLSGMYMLGQGLPQDHEKAILWLRRAADQGYAYGQCGLAIMYENGECMPQDYIEAYKWFSLAARQGNEKAIESLASISTAMLQEEISEALRRVSTWNRREHNTL